ncbi:hypothetical protein [Atopobacter phocae]|uniref:hypothetical protein n=1 Tax=Atopobacter phocae TaxID=136492 RepID=UPI0004AE3E98|nr:hypothetical protein [Atopobacter phocae]
MAITMVSFLARKIGFIASVIVHTVLSVIGIFFADTSFWLIYPYSWGARLLVPVMHLLPNGLYATANNPMLTNTSVIIPSVLSVVYFIGLNVFLSKWFSKLEVI